MLGSYEQKKNLSSAIRKAKSCLQYIGIAKRLIFFIFVKIEKKNAKQRFRFQFFIIAFHSKQILHSTTTKNGGEANQKKKTYFQRAFSMTSHMLC